MRVGYAATPATVSYSVGLRMFHTAPNLERCSTRTVPLAGLGFSPHKGTHTKAGKHLVSPFAKLMFRGKKSAEIRNFSCKSAANQLWKFGFPLNFSFDR